LFCSRSELLSKNSTASQSWRGLQGHRRLRYYDPGRSAVSLTAERDAVLLAFPARPPWPSRRSADLRGLHSPPRRSIEMIISAALYTFASPSETLLFPRGPSPPFARLRPRPSARSRLFWTPLLGLPEIAPPPTSAMCVHSQVLSEDRSLRHEVATPRACSVLVVPPDFDGLLHTLPRRSIAPCNRSWGSPGFRPSRGPAPLPRIAARHHNGAALTVVLTGAPPSRVFPSPAAAARHRAAMPSRRSDDLHGRITHASAHSAIPSSPLRRPQGFEPPSSPLRPPAVADTLTPDTPMGFQLP